MINRLQPLLAPASIAIVGASATPGKYGHTVLGYLQRAGYQGRIFPINPDGGVHDGVQYYRSLEDVPERIDCAFTVIPAAVTPAVVRAGAKARVRAMILGASGFAEMGSDAGRQRQAEIVETARTSGMIVLGPNTNGIWNAHHHVALGYNTSHGEPMHKGPVSIAAHSGALFDSFLPRLTAFGCGISKLIPLGNEATLDMLEVLEALIEDPQTQVIGLIMEAIRDGAKFRVLAARAHAAGKPIFVLKLGRSAAGATAAIAHSSRLAGSFRAYEALMRECGVPIVHSIETLAAVCTLAADKRALRLKGDTRLIGVSGSGGGCSLMADHAAERGIALAGDGNGAWTGETAKVIASYAGTGFIRNPIDGGNLHGWDKLPELIDAMERDGLSGPTAAFAHRLPTLAGDLSMLVPLVSRKQRTGSPVVIMSPGGLRAKVVERCTAEGIPVFSDLAACFDSLRALYDALGFAQERNETRREDGQQSVHGRLPDSTTVRVHELIAGARGEFLTEIKSAEVLKLAGVDVVESRVVASTADAHQAAEAFGYPVVLKAIAEGIAHKNDAGLVAVDIMDAAALALAFERLLAAARDLGGKRERVEIILQPCVRARTELIIGVTFEPGLGHFLIAGFGGINAELIDSVELLPIPLPIETIKRRVAASRIGGQLERTQRSGQPDLVDGVVANLAALQRLILAAPDLIHSIDVNPLLVGPAGCVAVDALIVPRATGTH